MIELEDIQGNVLKAYKPDASAYAFLTVKDRVAAKRWLTKIRGRVQTAKRPLRWPTLNIAVSHPGLRALGVGQASLDCFPQAFQDGMAARAGVLGDRGASAPEQWDAPFRDQDSLHLLVIVTGTEGAVSDRLDELERDWTASGLRTLVGGLRARVRDKREHFGYVDGISQPRVAGVHTGCADGVRDDNSEQPLQPGEFILGLPDEDEPAPPLAKPAELTRHGSYLVLRKLRQDVTAFDRRLESVSTLTGMDRELVAAKLMGRWRNGTPLSLRPHGPDDSLAGDETAVNRFGYDHDVMGYRCPVGAHIRRANPRGSLEFGGRLERRHRIIRRGMPYGEDLSDTNLKDDRGLVFVCYQADIERQFEFVQSAWLGDGNAFALGTDQDPFLGDPTDGTGWMRIEQGPTQAPLLIPAFQDTVTVGGGGYFLLPSITALGYLGRPDSGER